ncbi:MAG: PEP-CTERM sorting domain-containing protein [Tepidisphaeraceae bacterium]|jgi:hypothetical protein
MQLNFASGRHFRIVIAAVLALLGIAAPAARAASYSGTVLYPCTLPSNFAGGMTVSGGAAGQTVGYGTSASNNSHALLWSGTAASAVDLQPTNLSGYDQSYALGTNGTQQVGYGAGSGTGYNAHALLWSGTAGSAVDLNPTKLAGFTASYALGTSGTQQVGDGYDSGASNWHALLWSGTADSAVDLQPTNLTGFTQSQANGTNGIQQVGYGDGQALLWFGTADSAVDLQLLLPATGTWTGSIAYTIDAAGNVYGTADGAFNGVTGTFAVEWSPVPEPTAVSLVVIAGIGMLARRRRNEV